MRFLMFVSGRIVIIKPKAWDWGFTGFFSQRGKRGANTGIGWDGENFLVR